MPHVRSRLRMLGADLQAPDACLAIARSSNLRFDVLTRGAHSAFAGHPTVGISPSCRPLLVSTCSVYSHQFSHTFR